MLLQRLALPATGLLLATSAALADGVAAPAPTPPPTVAAAPAPFVWQSGLRYWVSTGKHSFDLKDSTGGQLVSRLTWDDVTGHAAETFFRADHWSGLFLKGVLGGGSLTDGKLKDEDFPLPPVFPTYSSTDSKQRLGDIAYGHFDIGYALKGSGYRLGAFGGYGLWDEKMHAFGCRQTAAAGVCVPPIDDNALGITQQYKWQYWRFGVVGDFKLTERFGLTAEAAYLAADFDGRDTHHFRPDQLPKATPIDGRATGVQLEAILTYAVNQAFELGIGARYWHIYDQRGKTHFEVQPGGFSSQVSSSESERYGVFLQGSYKLGAEHTSGHGGSTKDGYAAGPAPYKWGGFYGGVAIGQAFGTDDVRYDGDALGNAFINVREFPGRQSASPRGVLGGVNLGYNWRLAGHGLIGLEADISAVRSAGADSFQGELFGIANTTVERKVNALGTLRARLGFLAMPNLLLYATGGLAFADTSLKVSVTDLTGCPVGILLVCNSATSSGWSTGYTVGGGYEYAFTSNLSWKTEYLFVGLPGRSATVSFPSFFGPASITGKADFDTHVIRSGINVKF